MLLRWLWGLWLLLSAESLCSTCCQFQLLLSVAPYPHASCNTPPPTFLLRLKENPYTSGSLCVFAVQTEHDSGGRVNSCYASWVTGGPRVQIDLPPFRSFWKTQNVSRVEDGQFKFRVQVESLWCSARAPARRRGLWVAGVCRWAHWPLSRHKICLL